MTKLFLKTVAAILALGPQATAAQDVRVFSIGSGDISGNYYPVARLICETFNASDETRRRCSPEPTPGSVYNLTMLRAGELDFALVQSDWQKAAFEGTTPFTDQPAMTDLRGVMSLFPETVTILSAPGSGIEKAADLAGKTVDIGHPASGRNATILSLLGKLELNPEYFGAVRELEPSSSIEQLCEGAIDAAVFVVGHPSDLVRRALTACNATIASFSGPLIQEFLAQSNDYQRSIIDMALYGRPGETVESVSVMATLVTRETIETSLVSALVDAIEKDAEKLEEVLPVLGSLDQYIGQPTGMAAPLHPGAAHKPEQ